MARLTKVVRVIDYSIDELSRDDLTVLDLALCSLTDSLRRDSNILPTLELHEALDKLHQLVLDAKRGD